jgi:uncharacterized coiled-coil DUF342 family protein
MDHNLLAKELLQLNTRRDNLRDKNIRYQEQLNTTSQQIQECETKLQNLGVDPNNIDEFIADLERMILSEKTLLENSISQVESEYSQIDTKLKELRSYS